MKVRCGRIGAGSARRAVGRSVPTWTVAGLLACAIVVDATPAEDPVEEVAVAVEAAFAAALGVRDVRIDTVPATPPEPLVATAADTAPQRVVTGFDGRVYRTMGLLSGAPTTAALADAASPGLAVPGDAAAWDAFATALADSWPNDDDSSAFPDRIRGGVRSKVLAAWIAHRRGTRATAFSLLSRPEKFAPKSQGTATSLPRGADVRESVSQWLVFRAIDAFRDGDADPETTAAAIRRIAAGIPGNQLPLAGSTDWLAGDAPTPERDDDPVIRALQEGSFGSSRVVNPTPYPGYRPETPPPLGPLVRAAAADRWRRVPELIARIDDPRPARFDPLWADACRDRVPSVGEMVEQLLRRITRDTIELPPPGPGSRSRLWINRDVAAAAANDWWRRVTECGLPDYLSGLASRGSADAVEDLAEIAGTVAWPVLEPGLRTCAQRDRRRFLRVALRDGDEEAVRQALDRREECVSSDDLGLFASLAALAARGDRAAAEELRARWRRCLSAPGPGPGQPVYAAPEVLAAAAECGVDILGDWAETVLSLPRDVRGRVIAALPDPAEVAQESLRAEVRRVFAAALADEGDDARAPWIPWASAGEYFGRGHGSRMCDVAATRLGRSFAAAEGFSVLWPVDRRDLVIAAIRADLARAWREPSARPVIASVRVDGAGPASWTAGTPAPESAWRETAAAAARDPARLQDLVAALTPGEGAPDVVDLTAEWRTDGTRGPAWFRCEIEAVRPEVAGTPSVYDQFAVAEFPDGRHVRRPGRFGTPGPSVALWGPGEDRLRLQLERNRGLSGVCSLRISVRLRP